MAAVRLGCSAYVCRRCISEDGGDLRFRFPGTRRPRLLRGFHRPGTDFPDRSLPRNARLSGLDSHGGAVHLAARARPSVGCAAVGCAGDRAVAAALFPAVAAGRRRRGSGERRVRHRWPVALAAVGRCGVAAGAGCVPGDHVGTGIGDCPAGHRVGGCGGGVRAVVGERTAVGRADNRGVGGATGLGCQPQCVFQPCRVS